jgi:DNA-binding Lrp family transcriptional regulator
MANRKWTESEEKTLLTAYRVDTSISKMAQMVNRSENSVKIRLNRLLKNNTSTAIDMLTKIQNSYGIVAIDPNDVSDDDIVEFLKNPFSIDADIAMIEELEKVKNVLALNKKS